MTLDEALDAAAAALAEARTVVLAGHVDPDADALGSLLALRCGLLSLRDGPAVTATFGRHASASGPFASPARYSFLPGAETIVPPSAVPAAPDVFVALDCASPARLGVLADIAAGARTVIAVDHHAVGAPFGDVRVLDPDASATAVLVATLLDRMGIALDADMATALYAGLVTDTGRFGHAITSASDHELAARLLSAGAAHNLVAERIYANRTLAAVRMLGRALEAAQLVAGADLVWTTVPLADLSGYGATEEDAEEVVELLRSTQGVDVACVLKEATFGETDGGRTWRVSLRSRGGHDVAAIAGALGGGGHRLAAGFTAVGDADAVIAAVAERLTAARAVGV